MKIEEIKGKRVKVSPRSITVKDEAGKTSGVIRNLIHFRDLQPNRQVGLFHQIRAAGAWGNGLDQNVVVQEGKVYYLHDQRADDIYQKYFSERPDLWPTETKNYEQRKSVSEKMAEFATVIPCYFIA